MVLQDNLFYFIKRYFSISLNKGLREGKVLRKENTKSMDVGS